MLLSAASELGLHCSPMFHKKDARLIQEVFYVYLNKFENAVTHLFLVILGNN